MINRFLLNFNAGYRTGYRKGSGIHGV